jgi:maltooligosyltrehalose trehalohydrolase
MGEEYGEENPFPFFCSFDDPQLIQAVREGRRKEFDAFAWQGELPDPQAEETFAAARLSWSWPEGTPRAGLRRLYRDLLAARRDWPALRDFRRRSARLLEGTGAGAGVGAGAGAGEGPVLELIRGDEASGEAIRALFNLGDRVRPVPGGGGPAATSALFSSEAPRYGGGRHRPGPVADLLPFECLVFGPPSWRAFGGSD